MMQYRIIHATGVVLFSASMLLADFQYQETTKITGGMVASLGRFAGKAMEPITSTVAVKGNRMVHSSPRSAQIIDLDKETFTTVDFDRKTWSVMTFEQMRQAMQNAMQRVEENKASREPAPQGSDKADISFKASVKETGQVREVNGINAQEYIMILQMIGTDKQSGQSGAMNITNDMWVAPEIKGYEEIRNFQVRMAAKMGQTFSGAGMNPMAMMRPEMTKGMAEMAKEMSKLKGTPVMQVMRMGSTADGQPLPPASQAPELSSQSQMPSGGDLAGRAASGAATGALDRQLGRLGGLGGLGGFGKKKPKDQPQQQASSDSPQSGAAAGGGLLFESTNEMSGFSSAVVDASKFDVPPGFKQVESPMTPRRK